MKFDFNLFFELFGVIFEVRASLTLGIGGQFWCQPHLCLVWFYCGSNSHDLYYWIIDLPNCNFNQVNWLYGVPMLVCD